MAWSIWTRLRQALSQHRSSVTFLSAFVVFATFIFKDAANDNLKEIISAIESVRERRSRAEDRDDMLVAIREIKKNAQILKSNLADGVPIDRTTEIQTENEDYLTHNYLEIINSLDYVRVLVEQLPHKKKYYERQVEELSRLNIEFSEREKNWRENLAPSDASQSPEFLAIHKGWFEVTRRARQLLQDADRDTTARLTSDKRYHRVVVGLSYLLFTLGWGLGLLTNVAGFPGIGRAE
jgi:DNA-binding XRE family transcriptional regulator